MKQTKAAPKAPEAKRAASGSVRTFAKSVLDRLFLRSKIWEIRKEVRGIKRAMPEIEESLDQSVLLLSKKIDYLLAKIDAYADVDDANHAALQADLTRRHETLEARLGAIEASGSELAGALAALRETGREETEHRQVALDARLGAIEASGAELAGALAALRQVGQEEARTRQNALEARFAIIEDAIARRAEVEAAFREELRSRYDAMTARLAVVEMGNAGLADRLEAVRRMEGEIGEAVGNSSKDLKSRIEAGHAKLEMIEATQAKNIAKVEKSLEKVAFNEFRQLEALDALRQLLKFDLPLPATRGWAASPDFLLHLHQHITTQRPKVVVELGSGVSTLVAAAALAANGGRLYSLDHDEAYAQITSKLLSQHDLSHIATVYHAPLEPWLPPHSTELGTEWQWYSVPEAVNALDAIDLLIVDGPPEATGPFARYPAVPHFRSRLAPGGTVLLDDARRPNEKAAAEAWSQEDELTLELLLRADREFEKGLAMLMVKDVI